MSAWTNWARTEVAHPLGVVRPRDTAGVVEAVRDAGRRGLRVKPVGAGHSFTGAAVTDGIHLDLSLVSGLVATRGNLVTVGGGTRLHDLNGLLAALGLAMENLGDIDRQSLAGALATGTHGTGARFGGLATQVHSLELVLPDGEVVTAAGDKRPDLFAAIRVGLGALGVVTQVTLRCVPAFRLRAVERPGRLDDDLDALDELFRLHDHVDLYWFPHTSRTLTKTNDKVKPDEDGAPLPRWRRIVDDELVSNTVFGVANRVGAARPSWVPGLIGAGVRLLSAREFVGASYDVFVSPRRVVFRESEYAVPRDAVGHVVRELRSWVTAHDEPVSFPVEVRCAAADDIWLSTAYERDVAYVAVHQYLRLPFERLFSAFEAIVREVRGRPHWGKLHSCTAAQLRELYPRFDDFVALRNEVDPDRRFGNDYLTRVLGR